MKIDCTSADAERRTVRIREPRVIAGAKKLNPVAIVIELSEQRYIRRQVPDHLKRFDFIATRCGDVKVMFRMEDADQATQKHRAPISNDYTSYLISSHKRKTVDGWFYGSPIRISG